MRVSKKTQQDVGYWEITTCPVAFLLYPYSFKMILSHWSRWQNSHSFQWEQIQASVQETQELLFTSGYGNLMETYRILKKTQDQSTQAEVI